MTPALQAIAAAADVPTPAIPSAVLEAVIPTPESVDGYQILPVSLEHVAVLESLKIPFLDGFNTIESLDDLTRLFYVLTRPGSESRKALREGTFAENVSAFCDGLTLNKVAALKESMSRRAAQATATLAELEGPGSAQKKMEGSGGGSPSPIS